MSVYSQPGFVGNTIYGVDSTVNSSQSLSRICDYLFIFLWVETVFIAIVRYTN